MDDGAYFGPVALARRPQGLPPQSQRRHAHLGLLCNLNYLNVSPKLEIRCNFLFYSQVASHCPHRFRSKFQVF
jgi:hypothetical protein